MNLICMKCWLFQGRIEYTVIGDNAAPAFFGVIPDRGNITIINQALLRKDVGTSYTVRIHIYIYIVKDINTLES